MSIRLTADAVGNAMDASYWRPSRGAHHHLVEPGPPALFELPGFSEETRAGGHRGHEADGHAQRHRGLTMGIAGGPERNVGHGEDDATVRETPEVDHVGLEREPDAAVAVPDLEILDPERPGPGVVLHPGRELARYRLSGRLRH